MERASSALVAVGLVGLLAGCTAPAPDVMPPEPPSLWTSFPRSECAVLLVAGHVEEARAATLLPRGFPASDTPGFLGLPRAPDRTTIALLSMDCARSGVSDGRARTTDLLVGIDHPRGVPWGRTSVAFYTLGTVAPDAGVAGTMDRLGFRTYNGTVALDVGRTGGGARVGGTMQCDGEAGFHLADADAATSEAAGAHVRLYRLGPRGLAFLQGNITDGAAGIGSGSFQLDRRSPLAGASDHPTVSGRALVATGARMDDARTYVAAGWAP